MTMKVLVHERIFDMCVKAAAPYPSLELVPVKHGVAPGREAEGAEALADDLVSWEQLEPIAAAVPTLRFLQMLSAGVDFLHGVPVERFIISNARGAFGKTTAEWALTALLSVLKDFPAHVLAQAEGVWNRHYSDSLIGANVLVVGAGDLAHEFATRAEACDARVTLVGRTAREDGGRHIHAFDELEGLLPQSDAVVLMLPLTTATLGLVDARFLARMKDRAVLVNAARGPVVVTEDLEAELRAGRLRAALDVTDPEPLPAGHPLWSAPGCLITPHIGGAVHGAYSGAAAVAMSCLDEYARTGVSRNTMKPEDLSFADRSAIYQAE